MARPAWIASCIFLASMALAEGPQTSSPASDTSSASAPALPLAIYLKAINDSDDASEIISLYARAAVANRNNPLLHETYVRRMLQLGLPQIAYYGARNLVVLDKENGLGWGVITYHQARRGEYDDAVTSAVRSVIKGRNNPGIQHNAGQLLAWQGLQSPPPGISNYLRQVLQRDWEDLMNRQAFRKAYDDLLAQAKEQQKLSDQARQQMAAAENALLAAQQATLDFERSLRDNGNEIDRRIRTINLLQNELNYSASYSYGLFIPRGGIYPGGAVGPWGPGTFVYTPDTANAYRDDLQGQIRAIEGEIADLRARQAIIRRQGQLSLGELNQKATGVEQLRRQLAASLAGGIEQKMRWDPPAVDGIITPELENIPRPKPAANAAPNPELEARQRLDLARLYLNYDMAAKSVDILRGIVEKYPDTKAAAEARELLGKP